MRTMGKVVEARRKKGQPSVLDLQKRILKHENQKEDEPRDSQNHLHNRNSIANYSSFPISPIPTRRSTRRISNHRPSYLSDFHQFTSDEEDDDELVGHHRKKKVKLVLRLPPQHSESPNSASCASESNAEDESASTNPKNREISTIVGGSACASIEKEGDAITCRNIISGQEGTQLDSGLLTPLPDKKLLLLILDRLQKKDTHGVFSEPVGSNELPDYHDIIQHPMDFGTVRSKLEGAYANLEEFEKDVFLICSNAMEYNAPDTIYSRQARSIRELARKSFENLRQGSGIYELGSKAVRRGRPPTKHLKKACGDVAAYATVSSGCGKGGHDLRNASANSVLQRFQPSYNNGYHNRWMAEQKSDKCDDFQGTIYRSNLSKQGKKQIVADDIRRDTYRQCCPSSGGCELPMLGTDRERKQLLPVGLHWELSYARSLARFAAILGPTTAWKIASKKIERSLPAGTPFGPGWVGENETAVRSSSSSMGPNSLRPDNAIGGVGNSGTNPPDQMGKLHSESFPDGAAETETRTVSGRSSKIIPELSTDPGRRGFDRQDSVPPDLNVMFRSQAEIKHPDLALQL